MTQNAKRWIADTRGYETQWQYVGDNTYALGGQSVMPLPAGVYKIKISPFNGEVLYKRLNIIDDSVIELDDEASKDVIQEIDKFWLSKDKYEHYGQVHKRGVLLWGPPGCGKSTLLNLLFSKVLYDDGLVFIVEEPDVALVGIQRLRTVDPQRNLITIYEDIDSMFDIYGEANLLSMLDGQLQFENILHLATTNYLDKIPSRIKNRPGRFDRLIKVDYPNKDTRISYINHLMSRAPDTSIKLNMIKDTEGFSLAHIKELFLSVYLYENTYEVALDKINKMRELESKPQE